MEDLEKGDVAETAKTFFLKSTDMPPRSTSTLTLAQVSIGDSATHAHTSTLNLHVQPAR